jgi:uncharacterized membrane protein
VKRRIWELDAFRGICIIGVMIVHFVYDLVDLYKIIDWKYPEWFWFVKQWGGVLFLLLSGTCITLGKHPIRRGLIVFGAGLIISIVTWAMYAWFNFSKGIMIYFGVLHCLGVCMLLWPIFRKLPWWILLPVGIGLVWLGLYCKGLTVENPYLFPIGLTTKSFASSDFFPLLPNLGFFLVGSAIGKTLYRKKESLLPALDGKPVIGFFQWCGRQSLWIYLIHQPILNGICMLLMELK